MQSISPGASGASIVSQNKLNVNVKSGRKFGRSPQPKPQSTAQIAQYERRKALPRATQLSLWHSQQKSETAPYLQITSIPVNERINPKENRYILVIQPHGIRAAGGQFSCTEAYAIGQAVKGWDWNLDEAGRLRCLPALEALLDSICKNSYRKRGEG